MTAPGGLPEYPATVMVPLDWRADGDVPPVQPERFRWEPGKLLTDHSYTMLRAAVPCPACALGLLATIAARANADRRFPDSASLSRG